MRLKYYLRGFGVGVIFLTILFSLTRHQQELTDAQIEKRAAALGMLTSREAEEKRLGAIQELEQSWKEKLEEQKKGYEELLQEARRTNEQTDSADTSGNQESQSQDEQKEISEPSESDGTNASENSESGNDESEEGQQESDVIQVEIDRGTTTWEVAVLLQDKGIITDANAFNQYMIDSGRHTLVLIGTFELQAGMEFEEIADVITSRKRR